MVHPRSHSDPIERRRLEAILRRGPDFTLATGPTAVSRAALAAFGRPVVSHYDPEFLTFFREVEADVARLLHSEHDVLLMPGEAALGLEATVSALGRPGSHALAVVSGVYGQHMAGQLAACSVEVTEVRCDFTEGVDVAQVEAALEADPAIELLTVVHCESAAGTINDVEAIAKVAIEHDVVVLVDAVASIGGMPLFPDAWGIGVVVGGAQKCLGGPVPLSLISVSPLAWERIDANPAAPSDSFVSLLDHREMWKKQGRFPSAPPVSDVYALGAVLEEVLGEGVDAVFRRHARAAAACRAGVLGLGLELWAADETAAAPSVTAATVPDSLDVDRLVAHVRDRYSVMLAGGAGVGNLVRIGHMGETSRGLHPVVGIAALGQGLRDLGIDADTGVGVDAAMAVLAEA